MLEPHPTLKPWDAFHHWQHLEGPREWYSLNEALKRRSLAGHVQEGRGELDQNLQEQVGAWVYVWTVCLHGAWEGVW